MPKQAKHAMMVKDFEKYLRVKEALKVLNLQAVDNVYFKALKTD